jgi:energy-coupling factor transporter transmembrane protein EcfT
MRRKRGAYPGQYLDTGSKLHRAPAALKVALAWGLSLCALVAPSPSWTVALALICGILYAFARLGSGALRQDAFLVALQAPLVILVFIFRDGVGGLTPALLVSARLSLSSIPGLLVQRTTRATDLAQVFSRLLPERVAFVLTMILRFLPLIARDAREIYALQILRGAPIRSRDLLNPLNWPEACHSLAIPLVIRTLNLADQVAVAARQRGVETAVCLPRTAVTDRAPALRPGPSRISGVMPCIEK